MRSAPGLHPGSSRVIHLAGTCASEAAPIVEAEAVYHRLWQPKVSRRRSGAIEKASSGSTGGLVLTRRSGASCSGIRSKKIERLLLHDASLDRSAVADGAGMGYALDGFSYGVSTVPPVESSSMTRICQGCSMLFSRVFRSLTDPG